MTELVKHISGEIDREQVKRLSTSRLLPTDIHKDAASVEYMMLIAAGLGIDPASAFQHIYVFETKKGIFKASISAHLMAALTFAAGHDLHVGGDFAQAKAVLIRNTSEEKLLRFRALREQERQQNLALLSDTESLYIFQRQQILDRIKDLKELAALDEKPSESEVANLRKQLAELHGQYDFKSLRESVSTTSFDLAKIVRFESTWTLKRARDIGLTGKDSWVKYTPEMLKNRAKSSVIRDGAIDVILGIRNFMANLGVEFSGDREDLLAMSNALYSPEELGVDVNEAGEPILAEVVDVTEKPAKKTPKTPLEQARDFVGIKSNIEVLNWSEELAASDRHSFEEKSARLEWIRKAIHETNRADGLIRREDREFSLGNGLESLLENLVS